MVHRYTRLLDIKSEIGELAKEYLKSSNYGTKTFENEMLIMDWGILGRDTIAFTSKMEWKNGKPTFIRHYSLNGEEVDKDTPCPIIRIIKKTE